VEGTLIFALHMVNSMIILFESCSLALSHSITTVVSFEYLFINFSFKPACMLSFYMIWTCLFIYLLAVYQLQLFFFSFRVPEEEFLKAFKTQPGLKIRVNSFHRRMESAKSFDEDFVAIRPEWTMVDRILACRFIHNKLHFPISSNEN